MMTFGEYVEAVQAAMPSPLWLTHATTASLASPGKQDTRRAIERAEKRGRPVTPADLRAAVSPESEEASKKGIMKITAAQLSRPLGSTSGSIGSDGSIARA